MFGYSKRSSKDTVNGITASECTQLAEELAKEAGLSSSAEAFRQLDAGDLEGTLLETKLRMLRNLVDDREKTIA